MDDDLLLACVDDNPYYDDLIEAYEELMEE